MTSQIGDRSWEHLPDTFGGVESISDAQIIREKRAFLLTDQAGNIPSAKGQALGLYQGGTRHLSTYNFTLNGSPPVVLLSTADPGFSMEQVLGNHRAVTRDGHTVGRCTVEVIRRRTISDGLDETLHITNYNPFAVTVRPAYEFEADFADIFEVRGHVRAHPGHLMAPEISEGSIVYRYTGRDGLMRTTRIAFDRPPDGLDAMGASFSFPLESRQSVDLHLHIALDGEARAIPPRMRFDRIAADHAHWRETFAFVHTDNEIFNKVIDRSFRDLRVLWSEDRDGNRYFAAGTPWFDTLFGRDSLIAGMQTLPYRADLARECLFLLSRLQGERVEPFVAEEPGKILHELREDELSNIGELPYGRYYGSVDSTPLFLLLAGEYFHWTADVPAMRSLRPYLTAALHWVREFGAPDPDGYLKYETDSLTGLRNQGWKDSENGIVHEDGSLCAGPIAMAEVQGYLYAALEGLAPVFEALDDEQEASRLRQEASSLRERFRSDFWLPERGLVPMALDGNKQPSAVMSSNAGQVLWSHILDTTQAAAVRDALFSNEMFTGWGIRTLSSDNPSFNPVGYHLGTIWPHDNAIIAAGLKRYGFDEEVNEIATALFDTAQAFASYRLPEVYGGHPRSAYQPPIPYPVACRPQAWASGSMLHILASMLGLAPDAPNEKLYLVRPKLPYWLNEVRLRGLHVGKGWVDLAFTRVHGRTRVQLEAGENVSVVEANSWPY